MEQIDKDILLEMEKKITQISNKYGCEIELLNSSWDTLEKVKKTDTYRFIACIPEKTIFGEY